MRRFTKAVVASGILVGALSVGKPADAHQQWSRIWSSQTERGKVLGDHGELWVCDTRADNIGVWVEYYLTDNRYGTYTDGNGSKSGCGGTSNFWNAGLHWFQGHSRDGGSTGWIEVPQH